MTPLLISSLVIQICQSAPEQTAAVPPLLLRFLGSRCICVTVETNQIFGQELFVRNQRTEYCSTDPSVPISAGLTAPHEFTVSQGTAR
jgi:hypothetical protein